MMKLKKYIAFFSAALIISSATAIKPGAAISAAQRSGSYGEEIPTVSRTSDKPASVGDLWREKYNNYTQEEKAKLTPAPTEVPVMSETPTYFIYTPPAVQTRATQAPTIAPTPAATPSPTPARTYGTFLKNVYISNLWDYGFTVRFTVDNSVFRSDTTITLEYAGIIQAQSVTSFNLVANDAYSAVYEARFDIAPASYYYLYISLRDYRGYHEYTSIPVTNSYGAYPTNYPYHGDYYYGYGYIGSPFVPFLPTASPTAEPTATPSPESTASPGSEDKDGDEDSDDNEEETDGEEDNKDEDEETSQ